MKSKELLVPRVDYDPFAAVFSCEASAWYYCNGISRPDRHAFVHSFLLTDGSRAWAVAVQII